MKTSSLTIHVIVQNERMACRQSFFVHLEGARMIERLRRILNNRTNERAMMFALTKGRQIDPGEVNGSKHLIITKRGAYWDMM